MKKSLLKVALSALTATLAVGLFFALGSKSKKPEEVQAVGKDSYWSSWISSHTADLNNTDCRNLVSALKSKITQVSDGSANTVSYDGLWDAYKTSDAVPGSESLSSPKIWDMYGGFQFAYQTGGKSYSKEGDCYNREHSVPKSWFSENKPAYSDMVHLVPTDGKVNGMRSNYAFGEVSSASYTYSFPARSYNDVQYQNAGSSKLGTAKAINGVSSPQSTVFEPDDQYKGDFARIYMYFAVRYGGGTCDAASGAGAAIFSSSLTTSNPYVTNYGKELLKKWHVQDPVSTKETNRNDVIEAKQGNRNPFVDYPEWADKIWGSNYEETHGDDTPSISISATSTNIQVNGTATLTATLKNVTGTPSWAVTDSSTNVITLSSNSGNSVTVTGKANGTKTVRATVGSVSATIDITVSTKTLSSISVATAPTKTSYTVDEYFDPTGLVIYRTYSDSSSDTYTYAGHTSEFTFNPSTSTALTTSHTSVTITYGGKSCSQTISVSSSGGGGSSTDFSKYSGSLVPGYYVITYDNKAMKNTVSSNRLAYTSVTPTNDVISNPDSSLIWHIEQSGNYWTIYNDSVSKYAAGNGTKNQATLVSSVSNDGDALWTASGTSTYEFVNKKNNTSGVNANLRENGTYGFACYSTSTGGALTLYKNSESGSQKTLDMIGINITNVQDEFYVNEEFNYDDLVVTAYFSDDTNTPLSDGDYDVSTPDMTSTGEQTITVSYTYGGVTKSATYTITVSEAPKTLSSISVSTAPTKVTYTVGEYFDPTGLVITRNFSDSTSDSYSYAGHTSEFTFSPSLSTALTTSHTSVTITYDGKSCSQTITVSQAAPTSITATVDKTFYVGETITKSDITVTTNTGVDVTESVTFPNYQFKYSDAASGGAATNKNFQITYSNLQTTLTVSVSRKAYETAGSVTDTITAVDLAATTTSYIDFTDVAKSSSARYAGQSAKDSNGNIQLRSKNSNSGIVSTTSGGTITSVKITVGSGSNTIDVYGKNTAYSGATDLYGSSAGTKVGSVSSTGTVTFTTGYSYVGIRSNNGAVYISQIEITYGSEDTAVNVSNYIMYTDTTNQCLTKYSNAKDYFEDLSTSERATFMTSDDYVISTARERLEAWARYHGESISLSNGDYVFSKVSVLNPFINSTNNNTLVIIIIVSAISVSIIGAYFFIRRRKEI